MLLNGDQVDALSFIAHKDKAYPRARKLCEKLKDNIPRQLSRYPFRPPSAAKSSLARPSSAMRKDVLAKCYGGDITRKKKLLEKQKEGKKKCASSEPFRYRPRLSLQYSSLMNSEKTASAFNLLRLFFNATVGCLRRRYSSVILKALGGDHMDKKR